MDSDHSLAMAGLAHGDAKKPAKDADEMHVKRVPKAGGGHHYHVTVHDKHPEHHKSKTISHPNLKSVHRALDEHMAEGGPGEENAESANEAQEEAVGMSPEE